MAEVKSQGAVEAMEVAEASRETEWEKPSFVGDLFLGKLNLDLIHPFPEQPAADKAEADEFLAKLERFLAENVDADKIDEQGEYDYELFEGFNELGAWGMKIPKEYGGLGFSATNYNRAIGLVATWCGSTRGLALRASVDRRPAAAQAFRHAGAEEEVPAAPRQRRDLRVRADRAGRRIRSGEDADDGHADSPDGKGWILNGEKLWCTNGLEGRGHRGHGADAAEGRQRQREEADLGVHRRDGHAGRRDRASLPVHGPARHRQRADQVQGRLRPEGEPPLGRRPRPEARADHAEHRPPDDSRRLRGRRRGRCSRSRKDWVNERVQWGAPIGKHEAVAAKIAWMASHTFAMEAIVWLTSGLADRGDVDLRLEAAMAKLFNTEVAWQCVDHLVQIRGGRGYETAQSLQARGEKAYPVERIMRDMRINRIFEGTSEIQHLFIAREAVDPHMKRGYKILQPETPTGEKLSAAAKAGAFYAAWYPSRYLGWSRFPKYGEFGTLSDAHGLHRARRRAISRARSSTP